MSTCITCGDLITVANPTGVQIPIQEIQTKMFNCLGWVDCAYGLSYARNETRTDGNGVNQTYVAPKVYLNSREWLTLEPVDYTKGLVFFALNGSESQVGESLDLFTQTVDLIVFANLEQINNVDNISQGYDLIQDVKNILRQYKEIYSVLNTSIVEGFNDTWSNYTISNNNFMYNQNYFTFKVTFDITYLNECIDFNNC